MSTPWVLRLHPFVYVHRDTKTEMELLVSLLECFLVVEHQDDINAQLGVGSVAADAELDAMKEASENQILSLRGLLGPHARIVSAGEQRLPCALRFYTV